MGVRKAVRCGATVSLRSTPVAGLVGVVSCRPAASESGVSSNQVEIDIGQQDRAATASTLNKARRRQPLQGDS
jgi:hypothetical protein